MPCCATSATRQLRQLWLEGNAFDDIHIGHGVHASGAVVWGFDQVEPEVRRALRAAVTTSLPRLTHLDGDPVGFGPSENRRALDPAVYTAS